METSVDMREAVRTAKRFIIEHFDDEKITQVGLEEIKYQGDYLLITIGFLRPWDWSTNYLTREPKKERSYKVVHLDKNGNVQSLTDRLLPE